MMTQRDDMGGRWDGGSGLGTRVQPVVDSYQQEKPQYYKVKIKLKKKKENRY